jgi:uncharacterized protein YukE
MPTGDLSLKLSANAQSYLNANDSTKFGQLLKQAQSLGINIGWLAQFVDAFLSGQGLGQPGLLEAHSVMWQGFSDALTQGLLESSNVSVSSPAGTACQPLHNTLQVVLQNPSQQLNGWTGIAAQNFDTYATNLNAAMPNLQTRFEDMKTGFHAASQSCWDLATAVASALAQAASTLLSKGTSTSAPVAPVTALTAAISAFFGSYNRSKSTWPDNRSAVRQPPTRSPR